ncbi:uncharacterized protein TNCV_4092241 [Trichonephila clavipes]|nr:uncharacterized protein TNCV_4092241 [Trichonephila clavipes]
MNGEQKTSDRANCKAQLALTVRGESRLMRIECVQRSQTLGQITTQLNNGASRTTSKRAVERSLLRAVNLRDYRCSIFAIGLHVLAGQ